MKDFILAALPWIFMGLALALFIVRFSKGKSGGNNGKSRVII